MTAVIAHMPAASGGSAPDPGLSGMRVLYVLKRYPRLSETFIVRELLGLEARGVVVGVDALLAAEPGASRGSDAARVTAVVRYLPRRASWSRAVVAAHLRVGLRGPRTWLRLARRARRRNGWRRFVQAGLVADRVRREGFDHIHAHFATAAAEVARDAAALSGRRFTVTAHAKDIFHADNVTQLASRVVGAAAVVTVSQYNARHLRDVVRDVAVRYVPNGLPEPPAVTPNAGGPIVCVARLVPKKGVDVLIRAAALTRTRFPIEIVGDGACRADLEALVAELGLHGRVTFRGAQPSAVVDAHYRECSVVVLPCRVDADGDRDGMPTVLVEAMARGLPVVSTDVVGIAELIEPGRTGLLVPPDDPVALAAALDRLAVAPTLGRELGGAARAKVLEAFAPARATPALLAVFAAAVRS